MQPHHYFRLPPVGYPGSAAASVSRRRTRRRFRLLRRGLCCALLLAPGSVCRAHPLVMAHFARGARAVRRRFLTLYWSVRMVRVLWLVTRVASAAACSLAASVDTRRRGTQDMSRRGCNESNRVRVQVSPENRRMDLAELQRHWYARTVCGSTFAHGSSFIGALKFGRARHAPATPCNAHRRAHARWPLLFRAPLGAWPHLHTHRTQCGASEDQRRPSSSSSLHAEICAWVSFSRLTAS